MRAVLLLLTYKLLLNGTKIIKKLITVVNWTMKILSHQEGLMLYFIFNKSPESGVKSASKCINNYISFMYLITPLKSQTVTFHRSVLWARWDLWSLWKWNPGSEELRPNIIKPNPLSILGVVLRFVRHSIYCKCRN